MKVINQTDILVIKGLNGFVRLTGKRPMKKNWQKNPETAEEIKEWIDKNKNYGVVIPQGYFVIDVDEPEYDEIKKWGFNETFSVKTGSGRYHLYYKMPPGETGYVLGNIKLIMNGKKVVAEIKTKGGQVVGPGSIHPSSGEYYTVDCDKPIAVIDPKIWAKIKKIKEAKNKAPKTKPITEESWAADMDALNKPVDDYQINYAKKALREEVEAVRTAPEGDRNNQLLRSVRSIGRYVAAGYLDEKEVKDKFFGASTIEDYKEVNSTINSAMNWSKSSPKFINKPFNQIASNDPIKMAKKGRCLPLTILGNAKRLVQIYGRNFRYSQDNKSYYVWTGQFWRCNYKDGLEVQEFAKELSKTIREEAHAYPDKTKEDQKTKKLIYKWAHQSESLAHVRAAMSMAKSDRDCRINLNDFDNDPNILNVENGTLDLISRELIPHDPNMLCSKISTIKYNPYATYIEWQAFIDSILDIEIGKYLQRVLGYSLLGSNDMQAFWIIDGTGCNGKSTCFDVIAKVLGDYSPVCPEGMFEKGKFQSNHNAELDTLRGARIMFKNEITIGAILDTTLLKKITGDTSLSFRMPYGGEYISILNTVIPFFVVNDLPWTNFDTALMRRMYRICFDRTISKNDIIPGLANRLYHREKEGILNWMLDGLEDFYMNGLQIPEKSRIETQSYINEEDIIGTYAKDFLIFNPRVCIGVNQLYRHFCQVHGKKESLVDKQWFSRKFRAKYKKELHLLNEKQHRRRVSDDEPRSTVIVGVGWLANATKFVL